MRTLASRGERRLLRSLRRVLACSLQRLDEHIRETAPRSARRTSLQMIWPPSRAGSPPSWTVPEGYLLRTFRQGDELGFSRLMERAGFPGWNSQEFETWLRKTLPAGFFFLVHVNTNEMAATAMACHNPTALHPFGASLSCVAADPGHQGRGLGYVVAAAATRRMLAAGYEDIYMETDDWRLPAIKTYLKMGWVPFFFEADMSKRWLTICEQLEWSYTPQVWPRSPTLANLYAEAAP